MLPMKFGFAATVVLGVCSCGGAGKPAAEPTEVATPAPAGAAKADAAGTTESAPQASEATTPHDDSAPAPDAQSTQNQDPDRTAAAPELPKGTTILHVGDSFAGALGIDLNRELKAAGIRGVLKYQTSSYIPTWASGKELPAYLAQTQPDLVLITLGANELEVQDPEANRARAIERLVSKLEGRPCVWIAPPLWEGADGALLEVIRNHCAPCVFLDSTELVPNLPRARDRIHPSMEARKTWALAVLDWLARHRDPNGPRPWQLRAD